MCDKRFMPKNRSNVGENVTINRCISTYVAEKFQHRCAVGRWVGYRFDHDHLLRCGQTVAPRYRVLKAFQCIFRKKANVSLILKLSPNFQGC